MSAARWLPAWARRLINQVRLTHAQYKLRLMQLEILHPQQSLPDLPADEAIATLTALKGIGPWTAEIYLMFAAGHPDVFPAGDVALQRAVQWSFGLDDKPAVRSLIAMAARWLPYRSTAALLLWRYYRAVRNKEGLSLS